MSDFEQRLNKAIERGTQRSSAKAKAEREKSMSLDEIRKLHTRYRLQLSEHIESCMNQLPNHFPGFQFETIFGEKGWGAACSRDDVGLGPQGRSASYFSRLEMTIRPFSDLHVVDLAAKGTIRNKELYRRNHFELISEVDTETFLHLIDVWVLEYAEQFAAVH